MNKFPLAFFAVLIALLLGVLLHGRNPAIVTSPLVGRPAPAQPRLPAQGTVLVNFFASWCVECIGEQKALATAGVPVHGVAYKDTADKRNAWLKKYGNPYAAITDDKDGRLALDWGVYGVPETFIIDNGAVRGRIVGAVTEQSLREALQK